MLAMIANTGYDYGISCLGQEPLLTPSITPGQSRGARAMLNMKREELAAASQVGHSTLFDFESGKRQPHPRTLAAIRAALEAAGVEFTNGDSPGVRLRKAGA